MMAVNLTTLRSNMKDWFDRISDSKETLIVTRKQENMVILPQSVYDSLMETAYLMGNPANRDHLMKSLEQYRNHKTKVHELDEGGDDENLDG